MPGLYLEDDAVKIIKELECDQCNIRVLLFLLQDPDGKFNCRQIADGVTFSPLDVIRAIGFLINSGMVAASRRNNLLYYSLTGDRALRRRLLALSEIGKIEWQTLLEQVSCVYGVY